MATKWTIGGDAGDPQRLAEFWAAALGYILEPGYDDPDGASIVDPDDVGPAIGFLRVPEPKTAKNRLHIDIRVAGPGERSAASARNGCARRQPRWWTSGRHRFARTSTVRNSATS